MRKRTLLLALLFYPIIGCAQYGTAPNNYYPYSYGGSIFRGVVADNKDDEIVLTFTKGSNTQTFTAPFETGCSVPTTPPGGPPIMPADIPKGTAMTAFFNATTKKVDGKKMNENVVIAISFDIWQGKKIAEDKRKIFWCTNDRHLIFRAY
ncbi:MAG: hypothetical protein WBW31_08715 [Candidatus Sulfotelmatobacter sp.]|jgi:hypothetical protein